ncbi:DHS-like NAD/FAD-binding domain-containing protein [Suhomyces tanzawaensis NRRL Y-17324]|uniref:DHS-like NAD/FAD-binding domain-containing protein n=1 Tax=Suhomyces tanzawaensis NRRL Y-17324 TaxID=984487 RepID=A0A1E4SQ92_9ASCO|nr:DHS-like NAD/FAD-binding domain-containing protein [Suhomyces tanzawaensis NRRL Y-17324]ODV81665.1 DHS-like NAD/FAD-binding domain-containing protein [Suhomyces tanzawaensis NRRL Y-17324]
MISIDLQAAAPDSDAAIALHEVIKHIFKAKKAAVLTGAGISCNAGIPDFRSSDGLYNLVKEKYPKTMVKGQDLFDISLFRDQLSLAVFCTFMESLYTLTLNAKATETHKFIKILKEKNKLLRCYTQNIDSLEKSVNLNLGINLNQFDDSKNFAQNWKCLDVVQLHGNLHKLSCTHCFSNFDWTEKYQAQLASGLNPQCSRCYEKYEERLYSGKRLTGNIGLLRPDIVLYGENHPQAEILAQGLNVDLKAKPDLLIVMGTSLKVDGVKKLIKSLSSSVHAKGGKVIFINKTPLAKHWESCFDYEILSDCDAFVKILKKEIPDLFLTQEQLDSKKLKNNSQNAHNEKFLTPPTTPTKRKRPALKRKNPSSAASSSSATPEPSVKREYDLPSPMTSFDDTSEGPVKKEMFEPAPKRVKA